MPTLTEQFLEFDFPANWKVAKLDSWSFYQNQFQAVCGGSKAIDFLAVEPRCCSWMIEVKDYRRHQRTKIIDLPDEVAQKVRDSLALMAIARINASEPMEKRIAQSAMRTPRIRVVLHLLQPKVTRQSKLFPRVIEPADVVQRLKQLVRPVDAHPLVIEKLEDDRVNWKIAEPPH